MAEQIENVGFAPGEFIREELEARGWTQEDLARILGRPLTAVSEIIMGKRSITTQTARELSEAFGTSAEFWLNLESAYQLSKSGQAPGQVRRMAQIFEKAPVKDMERRGWIKATEDAAGLERELCRFYRIKEISADPQLTIAARQSVTSDALTSAQVAWCYRALSLADAVAAKPYNRAGFLDALPKLRQLAAHPESAQNVPRFLSEHGVRLVIVEHLPKTKIDGAALMDRGRPVIAISLRYDRIDWFWHTLLHEVSHILNGDGDAMLDVDITQDGDIGWSVSPDKEQRANADAADMLIPREQLDSFILRVNPLFSKTKIIQFANRVKIHPGVVVGQLQHRKAIGYSANREMLVKIREHIVESAMTDGFGHTPQGL